VSYAPAGTLAAPVIRLSPQTRVPWGLAEVFVIGQTAIPALLFLPGTQPVRLYLRVAAFAFSAAMLGYWFVVGERRTSPHPARPWAIAALAYVAAMIFHPWTNTTLAGIAQLGLYLSVVAPLFWAPGLIRSSERLARVMALLLVCNGVNSLVGVLQVYDPARWMPREMSRIVTESDYGLGAVTYEGPNGTIVRPPGLFDNPGAVAGPGMFAALLGLVFALSASAAWKRIAALGASFAGVAAIYLSQVRVSLVVAIVMLGAYAWILVAQNRRARAAKFGVAAAIMMVATFSFALALGGESISQRTFSLFERDPLSLYSASRGGQLVYTFDELLQAYPLGAGLGRWGMISGYFGSSANPDSQPLWAEIQVAGWAIDGGLPLLVLSLAALGVTLTSEWRVARTHGDPKIRACAAVVLAANVGTAALIFSFTPFVTQVGVQFWFLAGCVHGLTARRTGEP
jgi:hypothetical protein